MGSEERIWRYFILIGVALVLCCGCLHSGPSAVYPHIDPSDGVPIDDIEYQFPFQEGTVSIAIPVDASVYWGARNADKQAHLYSEIEDEEWIPRYYRSFLIDPDLFPFYDAVGDACAEVRDTENLDDDEYLELITVFVQSLPYAEEKTTENPKFPIETLVDGEGDCDDKSLLLAALLAREGYDVVLFYFGDENHMAVGVKSPHWSYKNTGYAFIETTGINLVGFETEALQGGRTLASEPLLIRVGEGKRPYRRCDQTRYIYDAYIEAKEEADVLNSRLERMPSGGREYNTLIARYNSVVELHNYIILHQHSREDLYIRVQAWKHNKQ